MAQKASLTLAVPETPWKLTGAVVQAEDLRVGDYVFVPSPIPETDISTGWHVVVQGTGPEPAAHGSIFVRLND